MFVTLVVVVSCAKVPAASGGRVEPLPAWDTVSLAMSFFFVTSINIVFSTKTDATSKTTRTTTRSSIVVVAGVATDTATEPTGETTATMWRHMVQVWWHVCRCHRPGDG